MATRLTYTTGARSAELDSAFESALAEARERESEPLPHLVGGRDVDAGETFEREDFLERLQSIHLWKPDVEQDHVESRVTQRFEAFFRTGNCLGLVSLLIENAGERVANPGLATATTKSPVIPSSRYAPSADVSDSRSPT